MGKELKDDLFLYSYDLLNESTVQVMIKKLWKLKLYTNISNYFKV